MHVVALYLRFSGRLLACFECETQQTWCEIPILYFAMFKSKSNNVVESRHLISLNVFDGLTSMVVANARRNDTANATTYLRFKNVLTFSEWDQDLNIADFWAVD